MVIATVAHSSDDESSASSSSSLSDDDELSEALESRAKVDTTLVKSNKQFQTIIQTIKFIDPHTLCIKQRTRYSLVLIEFVFVLLVFEK